MSAVRRATTAICLAALSACDPSTDPTQTVGGPVLQVSAGAEPRVTGNGDVLRDLGSGEELTTFSYSAVGHADGTASGQYQYNFRAADFFIHGSVTCVSVAGNEGWIGGLIDRITSNDPADQALVGTEIWWRVQDNGQGDGSVADQTSSLLFAVPGLPITAASWCADQNVRGVMRGIIAGNIQVR